jgi:hypothetical protein
MRKPNYRFERAERDRLKKAKKEEKLQRRQQERATERAADGRPRAGYGNRVARKLIYRPLSRNRWSLPGPSLNALTRGSAQQRSPVATCSAV